MKRLRGALLFLGMIFFAAAAWAKSDALFEEANAKYRAGDYPAAVSAYQKMIASGKGTAAVYYNLGNADFRAGHKGQALLDYERAHRLNPRSRDVEWNKSVLKSALADRIEDSEENVLVSSLERLLEWVTMDEAAFLLTLLLAALFLVSAIHFISRRPEKWTAGLGGVIVFLWILSAAVFYSKWLTVKDPRLVVIDQEAAARYGPSEKETKAFVLHEGAEAKVIDRTEDWYYILLQNKTTGWIQKKSCEII